VVLRVLIEQQTALLGAHAESMHLQRVLIERLFGSATALSERVQPAPTVSPVNAHVAIHSEAAPGPNEQASAPDDTPTDAGEPVAIVASAQEPQHGADPPPVTTPGQQPALLVIASTAMRSDRYYQSPKRPEPPPARPISREGLDVLRGIQAAGEVAQLLITFGPHAGETLGQVAQRDPDYLRRLATGAQRPDSRAAAARLVAALPSASPAHGWRTPQKSRRGTWRGTS